MCHCSPFKLAVHCGSAACDAAWAKKKAMMESEQFKQLAAPDLNAKLAAAGLPYSCAMGVSKEDVNHPRHYGGDTTYEVIKVIEAWGLGFNLGNTVKYIGRAGKKGLPLKDLKKAAWYLQREIQQIEGVPMPGEPTPYLQVTGIAEIQRQQNQRLDATIGDLAVKSNRCRP